MEKSEKKKPRFNFKEFNKIILIMLGIWFGLALIATIVLICVDKIETAGQTGDTFGVINSLFTCLAFGALWYSIRLQKEELADTRAVFEEQTENQVRQNENLIKQSFETTFFNMLNSNQVVVDNLEFTGARGHTAMRVFMDDFRERAGAYSKTTRNDFQSNQNAYKEIITQTHETFYRFIFSIDTMISYVHANHLDNGNRHFYLSILASTFPQSTKEYVMLFSTYDIFMNQPKNDLRDFIQLIRY